ncbi:hypothetical protein [Oculatella sp. FACHB-28]|nr:hypothetical protein [Oculatella sp. FACHB-28]
MSPILIWLGKAPDRWHDIELGQLNPAYSGTCSLNGFRGCQE